MVHNLELQDLAQHIKCVTSEFDFLIVSHVYKELNQQIDTLLNERLRLPIGKIHMVESSLDEIVELR